MPKKLLIEIDEADWKTIWNMLQERSGYFAQDLRGMLSKGKKIDPLVLIEVQGGVADITYAAPEISAYIIDWDNLRDGGNQCPWCMDREISDQEDVDLTELDICPGCGFPVNGVGVVQFLQKAVHSANKD